MKIIHWIAIILCLSTLNIPARANENLTLIPQKNTFPLQNNTSDFISVESYRLLSDHDQAQPPVPTLETYIIARKANGYPVIIDTLKGHTPEFQEHDLDNDQNSEFYIFYHAGGHTHFLKILKLEKNNIREIANIVSDILPIAIKDNQIIVRSGTINRADHTMEIYELNHEGLILKPQFPVDDNE